MFPLGVRLAVVTTALTVVPLVAVGIALIGINARAIEELSREVQLLALDDLSRTIDQELVEAQGALDTAGSLFASSTLRDEERISVLQAMVRGQEALDHLALYAPDGRQIVVVEEAGRHADVPAVLPAAMRQEVEELHVSTGEVTVIDGVSRALVAVRIRVGDRTTGYVASNISLEDVQRRVERLAGAAARRPPAASSSGARRCSPTCSRSSRRTSRSSACASRGTPRSA